MWKEENEALHSSNSNSKFNVDDDDFNRNTRINKNKNKNLCDVCLGQMGNVLSLLLKFDFYSFPFDFSYQQRNTFQHRYGLVATGVVFVFIVLLIIDNTVFYAEKNMCPWYKSEKDIKYDYDLDFKKNFFLFFSVYNRINKAYFLPSDISNNFNANLEIIVFNMATSTQSRTRIPFVSCDDTRLPQFDTDFIESFPYTIFCPSQDVLRIERSGQDLLMISFTIQRKATVSLPEFSRLEIGFMDYYLTENNKMNFGYNVTTYDITNTNAELYMYSTTIKQSEFIYYNALNSVSRKEKYYSFGEFTTTTSKRKESPVWVDTVFLLDIALPIQSDIIEIQTFSFLYIIGTISGWWVFLYYLGRFIIVRFIRVLKYISLGIRCFNVVIPEKIAEMQQNASKWKSMFHIEKNLHPEIVTDQMMNHLSHSGLELTFWEIVKFFFLCNCLKSKATKEKEKLWWNIIDQLQSSLNVVAIATTIQEFTFLQEWIFEPYQRRIFTQLTFPIVTSKNVWSPYKYENDSLIPREKVISTSISKLKDTLIAFQGTDFYSNIDLSLIHHINIEEDQKLIFFDIEKKSEIINKKYLNWVEEVDHREKMLKQDQFEEYFFNNYNSLVSLTKIQKTFNMKTKQSRSDYIDLCNENKVYQRHFNKELQRELLINKSNSNKFLAQINKIRLFFIDYVENAVFLVFNFIDHLFFISAPMAFIKNNFNTPTINAFEGIRHIIRVIVVFSFMNLYLFIRAFLNNTISPQCSSSILCVGFWSYNWKPRDWFFTYTTSGIIFVMIITIYTMMLIMNHFMKRSSLSAVGTSGNLDKKYSLSELVFTSPTFKIKNQAQATRSLKEFVYNIPIAVDLSKLKTEWTYWNTLIIAANIGIIIGEVFLSIGGIHLFKVSKMKSYFMRVSIFSLSLGAVINLIVWIQNYLCNCMTTITQEQRMKYKFWLTFSSKFSCFTVIISSNYWFLLQRGTNEWITSWYWNYEPDRFICREDQSAENFFWFIVYEFAARKWIMSMYIITTKNTGITYTSELALAITMNQMLLIFISMIVFPLLGTLCLVILVLDFHIEYLLLRLFRRNSNYHSYNNILSIYTMIAFCIVSAYYAMLRVIFQNQFIIFENYVPELVDNQEMAGMYPPMCRHQSVEDDFQWQWSNYFREELFNVFWNGMNFIWLPMIFGIFTIMFSGRMQMRKSQRYLSKILEDVGNSKKKNKEREFFKNEKFRDVIEMYRKYLNNEI